ncbi:6,7-dimethyl-8-ribityllumazine synthase [Candidatus Peregrinibacteria bacterium RIFCSPLOWO2_02_FULL_39_10]|nr:MAG: 6,7-dimethyl-8-ribityllumazine synthase [Candidatus Peregrinibacteria bacterium RIFCSPLOWO2_02_FULL_39_10]
MELKSTKKIEIDGSKLKIAIVLPYFNDKIGVELFLNAKEELEKNGVKERNITLIRVAGALEIPFACQKIALRKKTDAIIALGVIIRGETSHYDLVCRNTYEGIMKVQLENKIPISFGVLTCENEKQAKKRASKNGLNKGKDAAKAVLIQTSI